MRKKRAEKYRCILSIIAFAGAGKDKKYSGDANIRTSASSKALCSKFKSLKEHPSFFAQYAQSVHGCALISYALKNSTFSIPFSSRNLSKSSLVFPNLCGEQKSTKAFIFVKFHPHRKRSVPARSFSARYRVPALICILNWCTIYPARRLQNYYAENPLRLS